MSVQQLRALGHSPDLIVCRSDLPLTSETVDKISLFCQVPSTHVIKLHNVNNLYRVPLLLQEQDYAQKIVRHFQLEPPIPRLDHWIDIAERVDQVSGDKSKVVKIAMVGKYTVCTDSYFSVIAALNHAGIYCRRKVDIVWIESADLEFPQSPASDDPSLERYRKAHELLRSVDGILVPGGFGDRGVEGKILAAQFARENQRPFLGICLGLQVAVVEISRNVLGIVDATSEEFHPDKKDSAIVFMPEVNRDYMGGTMRL